MNDFDWVLLVDDDKINNYINERLIKKLNLASQINVAFNGEEALEALEQLITTESKSNGFIFLDINMPVMDGFEFLEVFKEKYQSINGKVTIVMLTTST
ncbi:MAG TPA: response regulator, partial [Cytophagaceae bacterium]